MYGVWLPYRASCSGDTEHDEYHVFTFLVARGLSPTEVSFKTPVPDGFGTRGRLGLFSDGQYVGALDTAPRTGHLDRLPGQYTWRRLTSRSLFTEGETASAWEAGIACANRNGVVANHWDSARALAIRPRVLLIDEPCSALDPSSTRRIEATINDLRAEVTIITVTHNMQQATRVSDYTAFFLAEQGAPWYIVEHGPTDAMFNEPQDPRTSDYVHGRFG